MNVIRERISGALRSWRLGLPFGRFGEAMFDDPTGNMQVCVGLLTVLLGLGMLSTPGLAPKQTEVVLYHFLDREQWALLRITFGLWQCAASVLRRYRWRWKFWAAQLQAFMLGYTAVAWWATMAPGYAATTIWLLAVEVWIAGRAMYDRDMNGTDRRVGDRG